MALTATAVKNAKPRTKQYKMADGGGLFLLVTPKGGKWWRYKYRFNKKEKLLALGTYPNVSLKDARDLHGKSRKLLAKGVDPNEAKKTAKVIGIEQAENSFQAARRLNERPRKTLEYETPTERFNACVASIG